MKENKNYVLNFLKKLEQKAIKEDLKDNVSLELKEIDKIYDNGFQAIFGVNIKLYKGEFLALLGPSGCGKSTTLRMIAGLEEVTQGEIYINNVNATFSEPKNRDLTMVFQNYALFPHLSVKNNISFGLNANLKKLGNGGIIYKQIKMKLNYIMYLKSTISLINRHESLKGKISFSDKKITAIKKQIDNLVEKQKQKPQSEKIAQKLSLEKIQLNKFIKIKSFLIAKHKKSLLLKPKIDQFKTLLNKTREEVNKLEEQRKAAAKNDDYKAIINEKLKVATKILGLENVYNNKPGQLSGGQRQRVALGRSIVGSPTLFLMDEPLSNLDAKLRSSMRFEIRNIHDRLNTTTVYVTHDQIEAMTMADKIAIMDDGFIQQIGSPQDIFKNPANIFVATFVGNPTMNLFNGHVVNGEFISQSGWKLTLPKSKLENVVENAKIIVGLRPSDLSTDEVVKDSYGSQLNILITHKELLGNEIQYSGQIISDKVNTKEEITFITSSYQNYHLKELVALYPIVSRIHLFDYQSKISLTSTFNKETIDALFNWVENQEQISIRREIMKKNSNKEKSISKKVFNFIKNKYKGKK